MNDQDIPEEYEAIEPSPGFGTTFGRVYAHRSRDCLAFRVAEHHMNPFGACHGGALATFADTQIIALREKAASGHTPTISLSVDYLAPARLGDWVEAEVMLAKSTSTMLFTQAMLRVDGVLIARSMGIYRRYVRR